MKLYIVTAGCYSDYHIEAVFTSLRKAELYIAIHSNTDNIGINEYETADEKITDKNEVIGYLFRANWIPRKGFSVPEYLCGEARFEPKSKTLKWYEIWLRENDPIKARKILQDRIALHKAGIVGIY